MYTISGLVALILHNPPEITFRFPRLYVSIISYLSSLGFFIYWYTVLESNALFYAGVGLALLGTVGLTRSFQRIPGPTPTIESFLPPPPSEDTSVAIVESRWFNPGLQGRHLVRFERGFCFLEETGKRVTWIKPRHVFRADSLTVIVETESWRYGKLTLRFDSPHNADKAEQELLKVKK